MRVKFILLTILLVILIFPLQAKKVSPEKAETIAHQIINWGGTTITRNQGKLTLVHTEIGQPKKATKGLTFNQGEATYYVFSNIDNNGFIIISADDVVSPLLGYSNGGNYDPEKLPVNFKSWMKGISDEIAYAIENQTAESSQIKQLWNSYLSGNLNSVQTPAEISSLVQTKWNQGSPYNNMCPEGSYTGCVATAMAQIMKYHNYPADGTLLIPGYTTYNKKYVISDIPARAYEWSDMINCYDNDSSTTPTQQNAVAELMYDCGVSVKMDYTPQESVAYSINMSQSLINYFNYDKGIQLKKRNYYTNTEWENILVSEIEANRPIYYTGQGATGGHAFICDGYNQLGLFHFNWGWGGYCDGYYITTALNLTTGGGESEVAAYNRNQEIFINIMPDEGGIGRTQLTLNDNSEITVDKSTLARGDEFIVNGSIWNYGLYAFTGECGIAIVDSVDNIISITGQRTMSIATSKGNYLKYIQNSVPRSINPGSYFLRTVSKEIDDSTWEILRGGASYVNKIPVTITNDVITHHLKIKSGSALSSTASAVEAEETFTVSTQLKNSSNKRFLGDINVALVDDNGEILELVGDPITEIFLSSTSTTPFSTICSVHSDIEPGNYTIRAVAKPTGEADWSIINGEYTTVVDILPLSIKGIAPTETSWNGQARSMNWTDSENWTNGVPGETTHVTIGASEFYPELTEETTIQTITFEPGAQLGRQDLLTYNKAFVDYNFDADTRGTHFQTYAFPLKEGYPSDFSFGGQPSTYVQTLEVDDSGRGKWVTASGGNMSEFTAGSGFIISIDPDKDPDKGLALSKGILRLPFFDADAGIDSLVHSNHTYDISTGTSTFTNPNGSGSYSVARTEEGCRLADQTVAIDLQFRQFKGQKLVLVGNPFMCNIDIEKLVENNDRLIKCNYQVWTKVGDQEGYAGYSPDGNWGLITMPELTQSIPPLQGFIVEEDISVSRPLIFDIVEISDIEARTKNATETNNKIKIEARNEKATALTFIAKREGGAHTFGGRDARKLMNELSDVPEVYTIKPSEEGQVSVGANIIETDNVEYPVGIATAYNGKITLAFSGMDTYNARVLFTDKVLGKTVELTGLSAYDYSFDYVAPKSGETVVATNDRFSLKMLSQTSSSLEEFGKLSSLVVYSTNGFIHASTDYASIIKEMAVYSLNGMLMYQQSVNDTSSVTNKSFAPGAYIVKVRTEKGVEYRKLIIR